MKSHIILKCIALIFSFSFSLSSLAGTHPDFKAICKAWDKASKKADKDSKLLGTCKIKKDDRGSPNGFKIEKGACFFTDKLRKKEKYKTQFTYEELNKTGSRVALEFNGDKYPEKAKLWVSAAADSNWTSFINGVKDQSLLTSSTTMTAPQKLNNKILELIRSCEESVIESLEVHTLCLILKSKLPFPDEVMCSRHTNNKYKIKIGGSCTGESIEFPLAKDKNSDYYKVLEFNNIEEEDQRTTSKTSQREAIANRNDVRRLLPRVFKGRNNSGQFNSAVSDITKICYPDSNTTAGRRATAESQGK